jgi:hypothetical protein
MNNVCLNIIITLLFSLQLRLLEVKVTDGKSEIYTLKWLEVSNWW